MEARADGHAATASDPLYLPFLYDAQRSNTNGEKFNAFSTGGGGATMRQSGIWVTIFFSFPSMG